MLKKIFKIFLFLILLGLWAGIYFYFFPTYPDYWISEEYFETRFQEEWFDSAENGFYEWKSITEDLDQHADILTEFDLYYKCYIQESCFSILKDLTRLEREEKLRELLSDTVKMKAFWDILEGFLNDFSEITQEYNYISTLNYSRDAEWNTPVWPELIQYTNLMRLTRGMIFFNHYSWDKDTLENTSAFYKNIAWLSFNLDDSLLSYLVIITVLNIQFEYLELQINNLSPVVKKILWKNIKRSEISSDMIQNGIRWEHQYGELLINNLYHGTLYEVNSETWENLKTLLFFDLDDSLNIMRKIDKNKIEWICKENWVKVNGKNWIWRTLAQSWSACSTAVLKKTDDIIKRRKELI